MVSTNSFCHTAAGSGFPQLAIVCADSCLAQETLQRSKGDAKQSTLQKFAPKTVNSKQTTKSLVPGELQRSATSSAASSAKQKRKARRSSSDSALLLKHQQPQQGQDVGASSGLNDEYEEVLPNRLVKQKSDIPLSLTSTPSATCVARASSGAITGITEPEHSPCSDKSTTVQTSIVGRRFRTNIVCTRHTQVSLVRQPGNSRDSNAIQVVDTARQAILGYLPREIAQHLAGLLDASSVQITATVDEPKSVAASVPILLTVLIFALIPSTKLHQLMVCHVNVGSMRGKL